MSTCLIITQGDKMYIGADSACSVKTPEGFRRYSDDMQKLFQLNEQVFFCSGNMSKVYECVDWIYDKFTHSICIEDLKNYLINNCNEPLDEYYNIEILIADYKANVVYQLSQYNNFEILIYPYSEQLRIICGGYKTKNAFIMAKKNILLKQSIYNIYHNTYQDISDECVGGYLYLYSSPTDFCKDRIIEDNIRYVYQDDELHLLTSEFVTSGFINGSQIIGGDIYSQNYSSTTGTHINLVDGTFTFAGGKLVYDGEELALEGNITATSGKIGEFNLDDALWLGTDSMDSTTKGIYIGTDGIRQYNNANQYVELKDGKLKCFGAEINGKLNSTSGNIAGWELSSKSLHKGTDSLTSNTKGTYIGTDGIRQYSDNNSYTHIEDGVLTCHGAVIHGDITTENATILGNLSSKSNFSLAYSDGQLPSTWTSYEVLTVTGTTRNRLKQSFNDPFGEVFYTGSNTALVNSDVKSERNWSIGGDFSVSGTKSRQSSTQNYGDRLLYCYEMPTPYFGDIGEGMTDNEGICYIFLDDIFAETIDVDCEYQVFLQAYGEGIVYVNERNSSYFVVKGTPNMKFAWELKAVQRDYVMHRLNQKITTISDSDTFSSDNYIDDTLDYMMSLLFDAPNINISEDFDFSTRR